MKRAQALQVFPLFGKMHVFADRIHNIALGQYFLNDIIRNIALSGTHPNHLHLFWHVNSIRYGWTFSCNSRKSFVSLC
ncbi:Uncharacterised protein [Actinobacillus pleuropneumoniae]|nr:Uncharacterised protein [Actinobacillus pleuropneumoniae]